MFVMLFEFQVPELQYEFGVPMDFAVYCSRQLFSKKNQDAAGAVALAQTPLRASPSFLMLLWANLMAFAESLNYFKFYGYG